MSNPKIKLTQAEFDALPEEATIKLPYRKGFTKNAEISWRKVHWFIGEDGDPEASWEEIEIVPEEEGEK